MLLSHPSKKAGEKKIHRLKQNRIKHSFLYDEVNFIHSGIVTEKKTGKLVFRLPRTDAPNCAGSVPVLSEIQKVWEPSLSVCGASADCTVPALGSFTRAAQAQSLVGGRGAALISQVSKKQGSSKHSPKTGLYCVVTSFTIMLMIRDPRGHVHRSMLGFFILSWRSWSSSQRSSFTSSAT